jgi:lysophospholipase L1-like esterase
MKNSIKSLLAFVTTLSLGSFALLAADDPQAPIDTSVHAPPVIVACVGDSITAHGNPHGYPTQLGNMLGTSWQVENYGVSGTTLMTHGNNPYQKYPMFQDALASKADVVVIMLGTNDTKAANWPKKEFFVPDYKDLVEKFKAMPSKPRIFIMKSPYIVATNRLTMSDAAIVEQMAMIDQIAKDENVGVLDAHTPTAGHDEFYHDGVHPGPNGAGLIAKVVDEALTGKPYTGPIPNYGAK